MFSFHERAKLQKAKEAKYLFKLTACADFELLCRIECSGEVKATCVNRELAVDPDMLFGVFVSAVGELIGRLPLLKPSGSENPPCDAAILKMIVRDDVQPIRVQSVLGVVFKAYLFTDINCKAIKRNLFLMFFANNLSNCCQVLLYLYK